ncbi:hypothetical protein QVD17_30023 [Tagetes erecta]|uniref:Uncharacterized protein n=1 Tax=Tagetes erecta TaxID=13708 RepID=A0AAD8K0S1_TARER|nr:hypothetical protein QVD17_30023 [Tagetes erecta]
MPHINLNSKSPKFVVDSTIITDKTIDSLGLLIKLYHLHRLMPIDIVLLKFGKIRLGQKGNSLLRFHFLILRNCSDNL